ncbi:hypothetical protein MTR_8g021340 [Medicago truncatula]|uniref:Reverse transcriptase zinc-binding domain-containing protein n=1 Tax=Medicago truncatula TaxID=3880 RepID=A0A072TY71_MEDTR|nr:hypothetical protein MTR_8g021340 [Medicago truncatula]
MSTIVGATSAKAKSKVALGAKNAKDPILMRLFCILISYGAKITTFEKIGGQKIPTRRNLVRRDVPLLEGALGCVLFSAPYESSAHLFLSCPSVFPVWYQVSRWLGWEFVTPRGLAQQFQDFTGLGVGGRELA